MHLSFDQMESVLRYTQPVRKPFHKPKVYLHEAPKYFNEYIIWLVRKGADFEAKVDQHGTYHVKSNIQQIWRPD